jgi:predicted  nucleic acid-binding Zn-ribbon protein
MKTRCMCHCKMRSCEVSSHPRRCRMVDINGWCVPDIGRRTTIHLGVRKLTRVLMYVPGFDTLKNFLFPNGEGSQMTKDGTDDNAMGKQLAPENRRPKSYKHEYAEKERTGAAMVTDARGSGREDKRGNGDGSISDREHQHPTHQDVVDEMQQKLDDAHRGVTERDGHIEKMGQKLAAARVKIVGLTKEGDQLEEEVRTRGEKLTRSERELRNLQRQIHDLQENMRRSESNGRALEQKLQRQEQENKILQAESHQLKDQYAHTAALLETRTSELKGAQAFLTKADSLSGAEVTSMVEGLNSEILQTAAFMADSFEFAGTLTFVTQERHEAFKKVEHMLGQRMSIMLTAVQHSEDPMLVQIALQSYLIRHCTYLTKVWSLEDFRANQFLEDIYTRLGQAGEIYDCSSKWASSQIFAEDQTVSGRWRALTHRHVRTLPHDDPSLMSSTEIAVVHDLVNILMIAGYQRHQQEGFEMVSRKFGDQIKAIHKASFRLNQVLREEITSSDLEPLWISPNTFFDPSGMEDIGGEQVGLRQSDRVLCITEMGLQRVVRQTKENRSQPETTLLLKPKVALESVTESMSKRTVEDVIVAV